MRQSLESRSGQPGENPDRRDLLTAIAIFVLAVATFAPTLTAEFLHYDDYWLVVNNERVMDGLSVDGLVYAFTASDAGYPKPLTLISWMMDADLSGGEPWSFHLTNVLLHAAGAAALFFFLRCATGSLWRSALLAALWAVHPLRVESVAWAAERKDVLSGLLGFLALWAYVLYTRRNQARFAVAGMLLLTLSLLAKPTLVTLPALLVLLDIWPLRRTSLLPPETGQPATWRRLGL
ncbi:MAG: hypothetical protein R3336_02620, partial [Phycisphaeraceae bacterium]|nr:hypothetical protein [Phycisphaeraceae bacterium]